MFRKKIKWALPLVLILTVVTFTVALAAVTVIDHFDVTQSLNLTCPPSGTVVDSVPDAQVLGGERDVLAGISFCSGLSGALGVTVNNGGDSLFDYAAGSGVFGFTQIQWDGSNDVDKALIDYTGLGNEDLTEVGTIDRFIVGVPENDLSSDIEFLVYTDDQNWSTGTIVLPPGINVLNPQVFEILFTDFSQGQGATGPANFANVGAIVMHFSPSSSSDTTLHLIGTADADYLDFSDLPDTYSTNLAPGPRNIIHGPQLGTTITAESVGLPSPGADADTDEGVSATPGFQWNVTDGGSVTISVSQCQGNCFVSGWIDWNQDDNFFDTLPIFPDVGEKVFTDTLVTNGPNNTVTFNIPAGTEIGAGNANSFFGRFRITERGLGAAGIPTWVQYSGETEDYLLNFSPTAVELVSIEASSNTTVPFALLGSALILLVSGGAILAFKRRRA